MFSKDKDREIARLSSLASDLMDQLKAERTVWAQERRELLDRIMILTNPSSYRIMHPPAQQPQSQLSSTPPKSLLPGARPDMRPPIRPREFKVPLPAPQSPEKES
jgi:hypothetical protein